MIDNRNRIEFLESLLKQRYPQYNTYLRRKPRDPLGHYFLDFVAEDKHIVIEWSGKKDYFGVSLLTEDTGYGEKPDNIFYNIIYVIHEIDRLLDQR